MDVHRVPWVEGGVEVLRRKGLERDPKDDTPWDLTLCKGVGEEVGLIRVNEVSQIVPMDP